jgi:cytochrome c553
VIPSAAAVSSSPGAGSARAALCRWGASDACTECHGLDLTGGEKAPDLRVAASYSAEAFTRLLRTGKAAGDRELELMSGVARRRFSHFNDAEIQALQTYLLARAASATRR